MILNFAKCVTLHCTRSLSPSLANYSINNMLLQSTQMLHSSMHVMDQAYPEAINRASKTLSFVNCTFISVICR